MYRKERKTLQRTSPVWLVLFNTFKPTWVLWKGQELKKIEYLDKQYFLNPQCIHKDPQNPTIFEAKSWKPHKITKVTKNEKSCEVQVKVVYLLGCSGSLRNVWRKQNKNYCLPIILLLSLRYWVLKVWISNTVHTHLFVLVSLQCLIQEYLVRWHWSHLPPPGSVQSHRETQDNMDIKNKGRSRNKHHL